MTWSRLIRFINDDDKTLFGEPCIQDALELDTKLDQGQLYAIELEGHDPFDLLATGHKVHVKRLVGVLVPADIPIVKCIGLNYMKHIAEGGRKPPPYPSLFIKDSATIAAFDEDVPIHPIAQDKNLDYEGELAVVIGKTGKNISKEDALNYIAGYAASNDVSARTWQRDPAYAGGVPQWSFAKGFDKFAPIGPMLVSPSVVGAADNLLLQTFVNGEERQNTRTDDLLFNVRAIVSFLSQGSTLKKGTVIMTGTPAGVAMGMKEPKWLKNGDLVEVKIELLGSCKNRMVYE
ncbi:related to bifunctional 4-hydroxyphenylacetate degradation enzyme [Phialocephala subalpina]|uniref:Related to bifunctional 4-hydroxyphenylacetate degradation enzyme n=1 Tax=Phialocephala subalpina TaxID=576137 RepID=A0A1L7X9W6_9HELO|nr:related to bifunctional 4-hydroxyphenylacetate degradation enzyme [Phialocephala subalpina]